MTPLEIYEQTQAEFRVYLALHPERLSDPALTGWDGPDVPVGSEFPRSSHCKYGFVTCWGPLGSPVAIPVYGRRQ